MSEDLRNCTDWRSGVAKLLALSLLLAPSLPAQSPSIARRQDRLMALARLDAAVHHFHPVAAARRTSWDSAFAGHILSIVNAPSRQEYRQTLDTLMTALGDPSTGIAVDLPPRWTIDRLRNDAVVIRASAGAGSMIANDTRLKEALQGTNDVVVDLRHGSPKDWSILAELLVDEPLSAPAQRTLRYVSFPDTQFNNRLGYHRVWMQTAGERFSGGAPQRAFAFIIDRQTLVPAFAQALRTAGRGAVIGVRAARVHAAASTYRVDMGEGTEIIVRLGERMIDTADVGLPVDSVVADSGGAIEAARRWAGREVRPWAAAAQDTNVVRVLAAPATGPSSVSYPSAGYRLLAAARLWNTIHLFFPYKAEMGESWDAAFRSALSNIENAPDSLSFAKEIASFAAHLHDSHVRAYGRVLWRDFYGDVTTGAVIQFVEGQAVVIRIADSATIRSGLAIGDVITSVDGEPTERRVARLSAYFVSSTPQGLRARLADFVLAGRDSSPARLTVRDAFGRTRAVAIPRSAAYPAPSYALNRDGPIVRMLPDGVGYVDLERLTVPMVDTVLTMLSHERGIIFDGRGYPSTPAWALVAARLNRRRDTVPAARFEELVVSSPDTSETTVHAFTQFLRAPDGPRYAGRVALLIDERAISQAEHLGLHFEAATDVVMVGSPTNGADGAVTSVELPGGLRVSFTGARVLHADGRPLQRVGLQPQVHVTPTIAGIRSGRDEVLERALQCLAGSDCLASLDRSSHRCLSGPRC